MLEDGDVERNKNLDTSKYSSQFFGTYPDFYEQETGRTVLNTYSEEKQVPLVTFIWGCDQTKLK